MSASSGIAASPAPTTLTTQQKAFTLVGTLLGLFLAALDQTIVATAGPAIQQDLAIAPSLYAWITTSYLVASTMMVPIYGKLSDSLGRKRILVVGIIIFLLGSALCGVSQSTLQLILARAVQGLGSASLFTSAFAVVADLFPPAERGKYQGIFGAAFGLSSVVGPLVGGFITDHWGWHWVFFVNLPIGALALTFIFARMPALKSAEAKRSLDVAGASALVLFVVPLLVALSMGRSQLAPGETGFLWRSTETVGLFVIAAIGLVLFVFIEARAKDPILDLRLFQNRAFTLGNLATFVSGGSFLGAIVFLPLFMVNVVGLSATNSGLTVTPLTMGIVAGNILSGQLVSRLGRYKSLIIAGLLVLSAAFALMAFTLSAHSSQGEVTLKMILVGMGLGPTIPLFTLAVQNAVEPRQIGVATSTITFFRSMGSTIGVAILGTVFGSTLVASMRTNMDEALKDVPPAARALMSAQHSSDAPRGEGESMGTGRFDAEEVKEKVSLAFTQQKALIARALTSNDPQAIELLLTHPAVDERMKATLRAGGVRAPIEQAWQQHQAQVLQAAQAGPEAWTELQRSDGLPGELREQLATVTGEALSTPDGRRAASERLQPMMEAAKTAAIQRATAVALEGANTALDAAQTKSLATIDQVGEAVKESFTNAVRVIYLYCLFLACAALGLTLLMPEIPLRKSNGPVAMAE